MDTILANANSDGTANVARQGVSPSSTASCSLPPASPSFTLSWYDAGDYYLASCDDGTLRRWCGFCKHFQKECVCVEEEDEESPEDYDKRERMEHPEWFCAECCGEFGEDIPLAHKRDKALCEDCYRAKHDDCCAREDEDGKFCDNKKENGSHLCGECDEELFGEDEDD